MILAILAESALRCAACAGSVVWMGLFRLVIGVFLTWRLARAAAPR